MRLVGSGRVTHVRLEFAVDSAVLLHCHVLASVARQTLAHRLKVKKVVTQLIAGEQQNRYPRVVLRAQLRMLVNIDPVQRESAGRQQLGKLLLHVLT